jgi:hypothetical protein
MPHRSTRCGDGVPAVSQGDPPNWQPPKKHPRQIGLHTPAAVYDPKLEPQLAVPDLGMLPVEHDLRRLPARLDTLNLPAFFGRKCHGRLVGNQNRDDRGIARHLIFLVPKPRAPETHHCNGRSGPTPGRPYFWPKPQPRSKKNGPAAYRRGQGDHHAMIRLMRHRCQIELEAPVVGLTQFSAGAFSFAPAYSVASETQPSTISSAPIIR